MRYIRLGYYQSAGCPASSCGATTLNIGEVQMFDLLNSYDYINASSAAATADSSTAGQGPELAADDDPATWFGSGSSGASASLELDLGASNGPHYDSLANITVYNRWGESRAKARVCGSFLCCGEGSCIANVAAAATLLGAASRPHVRPNRPSLAKHAMRRQDDCQDMLQCFGLEVYSELNALLEAQRFTNIGSQTVYALFFYRPP